MSEAPAVSVCLPASRPGPSLRRAVASVLAQTAGDLELIVTDDHGGLEALVTESGDGRVRYVRNPRRLGMAGNTRAAAALARGRYIGFLHDDDWWLPDYLGRLLPRFADPGGPAVVFADAWLDEARTQRLIGGRVAPGLHRRFLRTLIETNPLLPSLALLRREAWTEGEERMPLPDLSTADSVIWLRIAAAGGAFLYHDEPLVHYVTHAGQLSRDAELIRTNRVRLWDAVAFDDPEAEALRRVALGRALASRAFWRVRQGDAPEARADLERAAGLIEGWRGRALGVAARSPAALRLALAARRGLVRLSGGGR